MAAMAAEHGLSEIEVLSSKIGRITIDWAHLEFDLFTLFRSVLRADDLDAYDALRSEVDIGLAMQVMRIWAQNLDPDEEPQAPHVIELVDLIEQRIRPHRNRLTHDPIYAGSGTDHWARMQTKARPNTDPPLQSGYKRRMKYEHHTPITPEVLGKLNAAVEATSEYLGAIADGYYNRLDEGEPSAHRIWNGWTRRAQRSLLQLMPTTHCSGNWCTRSRSAGERAARNSCSGETLNRRHRRSNRHRHALASRSTAAFIQSHASSTASQAASRSAT